MAVERVVKIKMDRARVVRVVVGIIVMGVKME